MPASRLLTITFVYQKKPKLLAISSSLIELSGRPRRPHPCGLYKKGDGHHAGQIDSGRSDRLDRRRREQRAAGLVEHAQNVRRAALRHQDRGHEPRHTHRVIQTRRQRRRRPQLGIVNSKESVGLHQAVPDAPEVTRPGRCRSGRAGQTAGTSPRRAPARRRIAIESARISRAITVRAQHPGQMMSDGAKGGDKQRHCWPASNARVRRERPG